MDFMVLTDHMASMEKNLTKKKVIQEHIVVEKSVGINALVCFKMSLGTTSGGNEMSQAKEEISDVMTYSELTSHKPKIIYSLIKRIGDILVSSIGLIILIPLFLIVALIMKCSEPTAPIFFSHIRNGINGKKF